MSTSWLLGNVYKAKSCKGKKRDPDALKLGLKELKTEPVTGKILKYKNNWIQHGNRMQRDRIPKLLKNYKPRGRRNRGRPMKRLLDDEARTGQ
jgi:hypothetical protein